MATCVLVADALIAAGAAGRIAHLPEVAACLLAVAAWFLASGATAERPAPTVDDLQGDAAVGESMPDWRWFAKRIFGPTTIVIAFPVVLGLAIAADGAGTWPIAWFGGAFVFVLILAFARQAYLQVDHRRASLTEGRQRRKLQRRNEELEALTGLATTMTQTLEVARAAA